MPEPSLVSMCLTAFSAVFILLIALALVIRLIAWVFPVAQSDDEAVLAGAIAATVAAAYPGMRVTRIEEMS